MAAIQPAGHPVPEIRATRHEYTNDNEARLAVLNHLAVATEEGPKRQQIVYPAGGGRHIATGVSSYNYGRIMKAVRENDNGWGGNFFSFLFKHLWINLFYGTLKSNTMKLADAVFKDDEESKKAFAAINKADGRLARALVMLAYENKLAGRLAVDVDSHTLREIVRKFVAPNGSGYRVLRHDEVDRAGLNRLFAGYKKELLGNYLARLGGGTRKSQPLNILRGAVQMAFDGAGESISLAAALHHANQNRVGSTGRARDNFMAGTHGYGSGCRQGSLKAFGEIEACWLYKGELLALRDIFNMAQQRGVWRAGCEFWGPELAKNFIQRLAYGIDPAFAVANKEDLFALRGRIYADSLLREDGVSVAEIIRNGEDRFLIEALDAVLTNPPVGLTPRRLQDLKWAFCNIVGNGAENPLASKAATYRAELVVADYPLAVLAAVQSREEAERRYPAFAHLVGQVSNFDGRSNPNMERLLGSEAELAVRPMPLCPLSNTGIPEVVAEQVCSSIAAKATSGEAIPPEIEETLNSFRRITLGEVPSDPRVRAIVAFYYARITEKRGSMQDAVRYYGVALENGYARAAESLHWIRTEGAIDVLIAQRHVGAAAAVLYELAARQCPEPLWKLQALADAEPSDPIANRILGMASEFGADPWAPIIPVEGVEEGGVVGDDVNPVSDFTEAARRYARSGPAGRADLLGMAQAGHAEALHILEQRPLEQKAGAIGYRLKLAFDADDNSGSTAIRERAIQAVKSAVDAPRVV